MENVNEFGFFFSGFFQKSLMILKKFLNLSYDLRFQNTVKDLSC